MWRRLLPFRKAATDFLRSDLEIQYARLSVNRNRVTLAHRSDRPPISGLGHYVSDHKTVRGPAEPPVSNQRHAVRKTFTHDCSCNAKHLTHAGSSTRAF